MANHVVKLPGIIIISQKSVNFTLRSMKKAARIFFSFILISELVLFTMGTGIFSMTCLSGEFTTSSIYFPVDCDEEEFQADRMRFSEKCCEFNSLDIDLNEYNGNSGFCWNILNVFSNHSIANIFSEELKVVKNYFLYYPPPDFTSGRAILNLISCLLL